MRKRIIILSDQEEITGGMETGLLELAGMIDTDRFDLTVAAPAGAFLEEASAVARTVRISAAPFESKGAVRALLRLLRDGRRIGRELASSLGDPPVDLVHTGSFGAHLLGAVAVRDLRASLVWDVEDFYDHPFERFLFSALSRTTRVSAFFLGPETEARFPAARLLRRRTVPGGVDAERFSPGGEGSTVRAELEIPPGAEVVGFLGQLIPRKRPAELIEAAADLRRLRPSLHLVIAGGDSPRFVRYAADLRTLAERAGRWVHLAGRRGDMERVLRAMDVLVFPSRIEPFGRVMLEALAAGVPVVAPPSSGAALSVGRGLFVSAGDRSVAGLVEAIASLLADADRRRRLAEAGRRVVREKFSAVARARNVELFYEEVIDG